ncbi:MAG: hypothetical protein ACYTGV_19470, partial [Planctomycetota bacterium]
MAAKGRTVDLVGEMGLAPFAREWRDSPGFRGFPLCPERYAGWRIPEDPREAEWFETEVLQIEELLLEGDFEFGVDLVSGLPLRCSDTGREPRRDWPPGVYLHVLRRLGSGDPPATVWEGLRRVEQDLFEPVPYLERLRRRLEEYLRDRGILHPESGTGSSPAGASLPRATELVLEVGKTKHGVESCWLLGRLEATERFNEYETAVAKLTARLLLESLGTGKPVKLTVGRFAEKLQREEGTRRSTNML